MNIHMLEFRKRVIYCVFFILNIFLVLFYYSDIVYDLFSIPILNKLPDNSSMVATQVTSTFFIPLKLSFNLSIILSLPYIMFHFWYFISPGLYKNEKYLVLPFIVSSSILFFSGLFFAFYVILPLALNFFMSCSPHNVMVMTDITSYMDFMFTIMLACGVSFQIPILINSIIRFGIITKKELAEKRSYVFIFSFILAMLLTPPDVLSQILLAIPIWLLFEFGLFVSK